MDSALIVSSLEKGRQAIEELLSARGFQEFVAAGDAGEARRTLLERDCPLCVINTPLRDEFGVELAKDITGKGAAQVLLLVRAESMEEVSARMEPYGVFVLAKPVNKQLLWNALRLMNASHNRLRGLQSQNVRLQQKLEDIRLVDRAKCALIAYLKMTEPQAHKYIEKQAMDLRVTKREVAQNLLRIYEG